MEPREDAHMMLVHNLDELATLADQVPEVRPVFAASKSALWRLGGHRANTDVLCVYTPGEELEQDMAYLIRTMDLQTADGPVTPGALHKLIIEKLQEWVEYRLAHIVEYLGGREEDWAEHVLFELEGWGPSTETEECPF